MNNTLSGCSRELINKGKVQLGNHKRGCGHLQEQSLMRAFLSDFKKSLFSPALSVLLKEMPCLVPIGLIIVRAWCISGHEVWPFVSDMSLKCIDREGLERCRTGTRQRDAHLTESQIRGEKKDRDQFKVSFFPRCLSYRAGFSLIILVAGKKDNMITEEYFERGSTSE